MKNSEYVVLTIFMVAVLLGGVVVWLTPRESIKEKIASVSAQMKAESMEPVYGNIKGGDQVVIKGESIPEKAEVLFGNNLAESPKVASDGKQIVVSTPRALSAGAVSVSVFEPNGDSVLLPMMFFYTE